MVFLRDVRGDKRTNSFQQRAAKAQQARERCKITDPAPPLEGANFFWVGRGRPPPAAGPRRAAAAACEQPARGAVLAAC